MSPFNQSIFAAKRRQHRLYLGLLTLFLLLVVVILLILFVARGTRIEVLPTEALPAKISIEKGIAVALFNSVYSLSRTPEVRITAERYYPHLQSLDTSLQGQKLQVTLTPLPATLLLSTGLEDQLTQWIINDTTIAIADTLQYELKAGAVELHINHPYHQPRTLNFELQPGEKFEKRLSLNTIEGQFSVTSVPAGASVSIDDNEVGLTPLQMPLSGGEHQITVRLENYAVVEDSLAITNSTPEVERNYRLAAERASLQLDLQPIGGRLTINGIETAVTEQLSVEANQPHQIRYSKPGYFSQSQTVNVAAQQRLTVQMALEAETGTVEIVSTPTAEVRINGEAAGSTPLQVSLQAIPHEIELSLPGYRTVRRQVTPTAQAAQRIDATLMLEAEARLNEAPRQYRHKAGGEMKLFLPNEVMTLGASRDERGQRANEFLRQKRLSRPFYAGMHEVTNAEYSQFDATRTGDAQHPVTSISWLEAAQFSNWLSRQSGLIEVYQIQGDQLVGINVSADGYRLLTEAEWEWLARKAGRDRNTLFVWGDDTVIPKNAANIADESAKATVNVYVSRYNDGYAGIAPVKSFDPELSGLFDMGGNVSEWTHDAYSLTVPRSDQVINDSLDTVTNGMRVMKGANWRSGSLTELRASFREGLAQPRDDLGFRIGRYLNRGEDK